MDTHFLNTFVAVVVDRGLGVLLVPDWARPWPEGLKLVRIPLPGHFEPRRVGVVWSRATIRIRLVTVFLHESRMAMREQQLHAAQATKPIA